MVSVDESVVVGVVGDGDGDGDGLLVRDDDVVDGRVVVGAGVVPPPLARMARP